MRILGQEPLSAGQTLESGGGSPLASLGERVSRANNLSREKETPEPQEIKQYIAELPGANLPGRLIPNTIV